MGELRPLRSSPRLAWHMVVLASLLTLSAMAARAAEAPPPAIVVHASLSGGGSIYGPPFVDGARLAFEEAAVADGTPAIGLTVLDDHSSDDDARAVARQAADSGALLVLGPVLTTSALAAGPVYAQAGLPAIAATAHGDSVTDAATMFRPIFSTGEMGASIATYIAHVLHGKQAVVLYETNGYGRPFAAGFQAAAAHLGLRSLAQGFAAASDGEVAAQQTAEDPDHPIIVLGTLGSNAAQVVKTLRRAGVQTPILGPDAIGFGSFATLFANEPEERQTPGFFTEGIYAASPMILDSANAETLAVAERFQRRFGRDLSWVSAQGYDAARLAIGALKALPATAQDLPSRRAAVQAWLASHDSAAHAAPSLTGPLWFTSGRGRIQELRMGRFHNRSLESAPLQLVPVDAPDAAELASGAVFETSPHHYERLQRVVYTGVFLNEIPRLDVAQSSFGADFYLWLRYARDAGPNAADPTDINFPNLASGSFDRGHPAETGNMPDGTAYALWRVQGTFRNDFDLHRFPFDRQTLTLPFFNARAASDRIVYVLDRRALGDGQQPAAQEVASSSGMAALAAAEVPRMPQTRSIAAPGAFRGLTQWNALGAQERRENLVTHSALGDPRRVGVGAYRELSGFLVTIGVERRALATLSKTLMPLFLMTLIMFASLYFPHALVKEKVTVAITAALSGAVLLTSINNQLGSIGYTVAVEYAFYVFFALATLCIVSVLGAERLRAAGRASVALHMDRWTRIMFVIAVAVVVAAALPLWLTGREVL